MFRTSGTSNHDCSAGKIEIIGITEMFQRCEEKYGVKYTTYVGDEDTKTFNGIIDLNPYGDDFQVGKKECVGHVEKRMGTKLRNVEKKNKGIGGNGKGKLSDKSIRELIKFDGLAIRKNANSIEKMRETI